MVNKIQCEFCLFDHKVCDGNGTGRCSTCIARGRARCIYPPGRPSRGDFAAQLAATGGRPAWKRRDAVIQAAAVAAAPVAAGGGGVAAAPMMAMPNQGAHAGGIQNQGGSSSTAGITAAPASVRAPAAPTTTTPTRRSDAPPSQNQSRQPQQQQRQDNAASSPRSPFNPGSPEPYRPRQDSPLRSPSQSQPSHETFGEELGAIEDARRAE